jgi:hypothetical protein
MKKWAVLLSLAVAGLAILPDPGEACFRRRCRPVRCQQVFCPPIVIPVYPPPVAPPAAAVTIKGRRYLLHETIDQGRFAEPSEPVTVVASGVSGDDTFTGKDRRVPKTTIMDVQVEEFPTVAQLLSDVLGKFSDDDMQGMGITRTTNTRVDAERRKVRVTGFIYAFKKESDHDYHVILGDGPDADVPVYMNVEVSGIPVGGTKANRDQLIAVRNQFKEAFDLGASGPSRYLRPDQPIPVRITGSLFWDVDHPPGAVGPEDLKPQTSWEVHPVSAIEFLDN